MTKVTRPTSPRAILKVIRARVGRVWERDYIRRSVHATEHTCSCHNMYYTLLVTIFLLVQVRCGTNHSGAQCCYDRIQVSIPCATVWHRRTRRTKCAVYQAVRSATRSV